MSVWERRKRQMDEEIERQSGGSPAAARDFARRNEMDEDEEQRRARRARDAKRSGSKPLMTEEDEDGWKRTFLRLMGGRRE